MTINRLYIATLAAALMAGCSDDNDMPVRKNVLPDDGVIRLEAGINDMSSRAVGYSANGLDELGLFVDNAGSADYSYANVYMKKDASGKWTSFETDGTTPWMMLWQSQSATVDVTAYAPYDAAATADGNVAGTVETDQTAEENGRKSDVLFAAADVTPDAPDTSNDIYYDVNTEKLKVNMGHALSKLTVNIRFGTEMTQAGAVPAPEAVTLGGTMTGWSLSIADGTVSASGSVQDIAMMLSDNAAEGYDKCAEAILVPQAAAFTVSVTIDGRTFVYRNADFDFIGGTAYTLNLLVGKDIVNVGGITVAGWTPNVGGNLETE